jgi:hypothetical protein
MAFDPRFFPDVSVVDTCSVWNMLSALRLYQASVQAKRHFCTTSMVLYECLQKPRSHISPEKRQLMDRLSNARAKERFSIQECSLEDLASISAQAPKGLGSGEMSCIAIAYRIQSIAFMTDERQARVFAEQKLKLHVGTTPRLYGYLHYHQHLGTADHPEIIAEHERFEKRPLTKFLEDAFNEAMRARLMERSNN